ncbi:MAG TPA: selenocysteine-specific translation elongation factor [Roseiflexaceae bacterium]|nr:selenocysteine-specific translation elongation factor [Roseiflexaceae bacterium]
MYVIGTAGHVDHGKSTLVKALTGIDPDRWEEEQRREMTIDLGFAWFTLPSGRSVSIVDVPGHERFIKNMLAGVGGYDAALLVVAADESVMPQTAEHLAILDLLEVSHGLVVLTKADLVDEEWLALVREEVRERLRGTCLEGAPQVAVSARTGQGLDALRSAIDEVLDRTPTRSGAHGAPRMSIDRAFTIGGFGAVVTGTLADGPLRAGDEVEILPKGLRARVRGLQTHQRKVEEALPGTRVAVNLAGVSHHDIARGDMLALPGRMRPTAVLDAQLRIAPGARPVRQNDRLELFVGAAESLCRVTLLDREELAPGESGWVQVRLERPIAVARGDRYILRLPSPSQTLGGGRVVEPHPARHRRFRPEVIASLEALARGTPADLLLRALADGLPHAWDEAVRASGLPQATALEALGELMASGDVMDLAGDEQGSDRPSPWPVTSAGWQKLVEKLLAALEGYHRRYPLRAWMPREELRSRLRLGGPACDAAVGAAARAGLVEASESGVRRSGHTPSPTPEQERQVRRWLAQVAASPYSPPAPDMDPEVLGMLLEQGEVTRVAPDVVFASETYHEMVDWVRAQIAEAGSVTLAQFRDRFGSSRKYAQALLEHLDERKVTRRVGDARVLY